MIALVHMPYAAIEHPSLALGILQAEMRKQGLACRSLYPNLDWQREIGHELYATVSSTVAQDLVGEWTFAEAAFGAIPEQEESYLQFVSGRSGLARRLAPAKELRAIRTRVAAFVERVAHEVLALAPRAVGCSSTFQQHCASLALLRRVKELDPSVVTVMGGANCEGTMGVALMRNFDWVDYVVSGDGDRVGLALFQSILAGKSDAPFGVLSRDPASWIGPDGKSPRASFTAMDKVATPDYDDYFEALERSGLDLLPGLLVETSRGCWWGQKHHCTFCGLNAGGMGYRSKSGERVLEEFEYLASRYQLSGFEVVDNILDHSHLKTIMPTFAARPEPFQIFYETKSNLKRDQLRLLSQAGVVWIQPGIESLHDEVLTLMDKGSTGLMNLQLLKHCREFGIRVVWNFLTCFPGEKDEWYSDMASWLPLIHHLQPAGGLSPVRYDRFSPYHSSPQKYGIRIEAARSYAAVYPLPKEELEQLAYFFEDIPEERLRQDRRMDTPGRQELKAALLLWKEAFWTGSAILSAAERPQGTLILDTRPVAPERRYFLQGRSRELLLECEVPRRFPHPEPELLDLVERKLVLCVGERYLSLPVRGELPPLPSRVDFPGGYYPRPKGREAYRRGVHVRA
jgi:magnesium-protoporphyrin IX monomethyl ester (oxidative) cyclase